MGAAEDEATELIKRQAREVVKVTKKYRFHEVAPLVAKLRTLIEDANQLPGANADIDPDEYEYPFERQSAYLKGEKSAKVVAKIEATVPEHSCNCEPIKCQCTSTEESVSQAEGTNCQFCDTAISVGDSLHVSVITGAKMCAICARTLVEKVRFKESVAYAVVNLVEDACTEVDAPYFQTRAALKLVEEAQERLESFRLAQRAKSIR